MKTDISNELPMVSVVLPNYNNDKRLQLCLNNLFAQSYPSHLYEVIVVDNGSTDNSLNVINLYPVALIKETSVLNPYKCRNVGIKKAKGSIIALLDSKCIPSIHWIEAGVKAIQAGATLVAGKFTFEYKNEPSVAEMAYSAIYLDNEKALKNRVGVPTGNLFIQKKVFDEVGYFMDNIRSGSDTEWSQRVLQKKLVCSFSAKAMVSYPAKDKSNMLLGAYRDGQSTRVIWKKKKGLLKTSIAAFYCMLPMKFSNLKDVINRNGTEKHKAHFLQIWWMVWRVKFTYGKAMLGL